MSKSFHRSYVHESKHPEDTNWVGGISYQLQKHQYQVMHQRFGPQLAQEWAEEMITWKDQRRPAPANMLRWGLEVDEGKAAIPEGVERSFNKRLDNAAKAIALQAIRSAAKASKEYSAFLAEFLKEAKTGFIDAKKLDMLNRLSSSFMHANNGTGFMYREVAADKQQQAAAGTQIGNLVINAGPPPQPRRLKRGKQQIVEGQFKELPVGSTDAA